MRKKNIGLFKATNNTVQSGLNSISKIANSIETSVDIALISLQISRGETAKEGVTDLIELGYTEEEAEAIVAI